ncbi:MAG: SPASM domain-containing protein [Chitinispirillaceae bacterium]|nr:SPASM domain-containing protein [Chitinispirillaceae bacterium]
MKALAHGAYLIRYWRRHAFVFGRNATWKKVLNFLWSEREAHRCAVTVRSMPWEIFIDPVNMCVLQCPLCGTGRRLVPRKRMKLSYDNFRRYLDPLADYLYRIKLFNYGEPFLNPDLFRMITYAKARRIAVQVNTNGNVWEDSFGDSCVESRLDMLVFSFDGFSQEAYASYRAGGDVERVKHSIETVITARRRRGSTTPRVVLQFLMQRQNEHEYGLVAAYAKKIGAIFFPQPMTFDITDEAQRREWLPVDEDKTHYDRIRLIKKKDRPEKACGFLWNNPVINVDGGISPCCHLFHGSTDFGTLEKESFAAIWNNEKFRTARAMMRDKKVVSAPIACCRCLNEKAFGSAAYDLINENRTNAVQLNGA